MSSDTQEYPRKEAQHCILKNIEPLQEQTFVASPTTTPSSLAATSSKATGGHDRPVLSGGAMAGMTVGVIAGVTFALSAAFLMLRSQRRSRPQHRQRVFSNQPSTGSLPELNPPNPNELDATTIPKPFREIMTSNAPDAELEAALA